MAALRRHLQPPDLGYADELIQMDHAGLEVVVAGRPEDISESELWAFLDGLPRRYLALFGLATIYRHVRLARDIRPDEVHASLEKHDDIWELSVVTLDKPFLFSNISGVLSYFGMDIHRGQAMTTPAGLVLDVFEFSDVEQFLAQNAAGTAEIYRDAPGGRGGCRGRHRRCCAARSAACSTAARERRAAGHPRRPRALAEVHGPRDRRRRRARPAVPDQPGHVAAWAATSISSLIARKARRRSTCSTSPQGEQALRLGRRSAIRQELGRMLEGPDEARLRAWSGPTRWTRCARRWSG